VKHLPYNVLKLNESATKCPRFAVRVIFMTQKSVSDQLKFVIELNAVNRVFLCNWKCPMSHR